MVILSLSIKVTYFIHKIKPLKLILVSLGTSHLSLLNIPSNHPEMLLNSRFTTTKILIFQNSRVINPVKILSNGSHLTWINSVKILHVKMKATFSSSIYPPEIRILINPNLRTFNFSHLPSRHTVMTLKKPVLASHMLSISLRILEKEYLLWPGRGRKIAKLRGRLISKTLLLCTSIISWWNSSMHRKRQREGISNPICQISFKKWWKLNLLNRNRNRKLTSNS